MGFSPSPTRCIPFLAGDSTNLGAPALSPAITAGDPGGAFLSFQAGLQSRASKSNQARRDQARKGRNEIAKGFYIAEAGQGAQNRRLCPASHRGSNRFRIKVDRPSIASCAQFWAHLVLESSPTFRLTLYWNEIYFFWAHSWIGKCYATRARKFKTAIFDLKVTAQPKPSRTK